MIIDSIVRTVSICVAKGIKHVVISPGSRSAPLTIAFARNSELKKFVIPDERSAAFIALGMALQSKIPTILVCTSGTAALNYYPAIAEAFYQKVPILVFTADRPVEWTDQQDGQTIRQRNVYHNHIVKSFELSTNQGHKDEIWYNERIVNEAINLCLQESGPIHINFPIREPFYPEANHVFDFNQKIQVIDIMAITIILDNNRKEWLNKKLAQYHKVMIVVGQGHWSNELLLCLKEIANNKLAIVLADITANIPFGIKSQDVLCALPDFNRYKPDLIISFGLSVLSKNLKKFLREAPAEHWHIQEHGEVADTFQKLSLRIPLPPLTFFQYYLNGSIHSKVEFVDKWIETDSKVQNLWKQYIEQEEFTELTAVSKFLDHCPENSIIHLANSMAVRYANFLGNQNKSNLIFRGNRGTSGIDGSNSTAVGEAILYDNLVFLITGDLSFFYDRNAFWHKHLPPNIRILLLNNHAGGIFRIIDGSGQQPELAEYFETEQSLNAENTSKDFGFEYKKAQTKTDFEHKLLWFLEAGEKIKLLEVETDSQKNNAILKAIMKNIKSSVAIIK